jgi:concanavalin A-like lectin/glucanase superfamily protein
VQSAPPDPAALGLQDHVLWVDTSSGPPFQLKVWDAVHGLWQAVGSSPSAYAASVAARAPLGYWPLTDAGTYTDATGHGWALTPTVGGHITSVPGPIAGTTAPHFDGTAGVALAIAAAFPFVPVPAPSTYAPFSIEFWLQDDVADPNYGVSFWWGDSADTTTRLATDQRAGDQYIEMNSTTASPGNGTPAPFGGAWHHVVVTYSGYDPAHPLAPGNQTAAFYLDGFLFYSTITGPPTTTNPSAHALYLGDGPAGWDSPLLGALAHVAFYDYVLAPSAVAQNYAAMDADANYGVSGDGHVLTPCLTFPLGQEICGDVANMLRLLVGPTGPEHDVDVTGYQIPGTHRFERHQTGAMANPPCGPQMVATGSAACAYRYAQAALVWSDGYGVTLASPTIDPPAHDGSTFSLSVYPWAQINGHGALNFGLYDPNPFLGSTHPTRVDVYMRFAVEVSPGPYSWTAWYKIYTGAPPTGNGGLSMPDHYLDVNAFLASGPKPAILPGSNTTGTAEVWRLRHGNGQVCLEHAGGAFPLLLAGTEGADGQVLTKDVGQVVWADAVSAVPVTPRVSPLPTTDPASARCGAALAMATYLQKFYANVSGAMNGLESAMATWLITAFIDLVSSALTDGGALPWLVANQAAIATFASFLANHILGPDFPSLTSAQNAQVLQAAYCALPADVSSLQVTDAMLADWATRLGAYVTGNVGFQVYTLQTLVGLLHTPSWQTLAYQGMQAPSGLCTGMTCP